MIHIKYLFERTSSRKCADVRSSRFSPAGVSSSEGKMESSPKSIPSLSDIIEGGKRNFAESFELSMKKAIKLRNNVVRNARALTGNAAGAEAAFSAALDVSDQPPPTMAEPFATNFSAEVLRRANANAPILRTWSEEDVVRQEVSDSPSTVSTSLSSSSSLSPSRPSLEEEIPFPHFDLSHVSATSVFDIGSVGTPVLGSPEGGDMGKFDVKDGTLRPDSTSVLLSSRPENTSPQYNQQAPLLELEDVRKFVGNAIIVWRKVRALGLPESSWENKMPWRHPRQSYLAKGLQWPPEEFSSEKEKHEYYRRARRRGRYLIGPTPTWSFIVADLALLYFLIDNPAGKFLL